MSWGEPCLRMGANAPSEIQPQPQPKTLGSHPAGQLLGAATQRPKDGCQERLPPRRPFPDWRRQASHAVMPKSVTFGWCSPTHLTWEVQNSARSLKEGVR